MDEGLLRKSIERITVSTVKRKAEIAAPVNRDSYIATVEPH